MGLVIRVTMLLLLTFNLLREHRYEPISQCDDPKIYCHSMKVALECKKLEECFPPNTTDDSDTEVKRSIPESPTAKTKPVESEFASQGLFDTENDFTQKPKKLDEGSLPVTTEDSVTKVKSSSQEHGEQSESEESESEPEGAIGTAYRYVKQCKKSNACFPPIDADNIVRKSKRPIRSYLDIPPRFKPKPVKSSKSKSASQETVGNAYRYVKQCKKSDKCFPPITTDASLHSVTRVKWSVRQYLKAKERLAQSQIEPEGTIGTAYRYAKQCKNSGECFPPINADISSTRLRSIPDRRLGLPALHHEVVPRGISRARHNFVQKCKRSRKCSPPITTGTSVKKPRMSISKRRKAKSTPVEPVVVPQGVDYTTYPFSLKSKRSRERSPPVTTGISGEKVRRFIPQLPKHKPKPREVMSMLI